MTTPAILHQIKDALALADFDGTTAHRLMAPVPRLNRRPPDTPGRARLGGVLLLLYEREGRPHLLLTRRRDDLQSHAGQVSFPGGRKEGSETLLAAALRETFEEVGVEPDSVTVVGELTPLYIFPSDYEVHPFVACYSNGGTPVFSPNANEVSQIIEAPLSLLMDPATVKKEMWTIRGYELLVPFFAVQEHKVWGATAMMISEFVERLRVVAPDNKAGDS